MGLGEYRAIKKRGCPKWGTGDKIIVSEKDILIKQGCLIDKPHKGIICLDS